MRTLGALAFQLPDPGLARPANLGQGDPRGLLAGGALDTQEHIAPVDRSADRR